jgi:GT2 family glycosyltransferase
MEINNQQPLISIQILNWNRPEESVRAIHSALNQSYKNIEVVIIDNGSSDHSVQLIRDNFPDLKIIELDKNYGCPGGRNKGVEHCNGEYIFYLDNDGVLHQEAVLNAYNTFLRDKDIVLVTGLIKDFDDTNEIDLTFNIQKSAPYYYSNFDGGICMHKKSMYLKTGLFPSHFMYGAEEMFLSYKIFENGFKIAKDENVILWHKKSSQSRDITKETINSYFNKLYTSIVLFPFIPMILFCSFFIFLYFIHAYKAKILKNYLRVFIPKFYQTMISGLKNRNPIRNETYERIKKFKPSNIS